MIPKVAQNEALSDVLIARWEQAGGKLAALAEEFPEDKYESAPVAGVRTFGDTLRHVAFWNQYVADTVRGKKADDSANELPKTEFATKARIVKAVKRTSAEAAEALKKHGALDRDTAEMAMSFIEHVSEHYGQLVVYARLNGVVPPASRT